MWEDNSSEILNIFIFDIIIPSFFTFAIIFNPVSRLYSSDNLKHPEYFLITFSSLSLTVDPKPEFPSSDVRYVVRRRRRWVVWLTHVTCEEVMVGIFMKCWRTWLCPAGSPPGLVLARCEAGNGHINNKTFTHKLIPGPALTPLSQPLVRKVLWVWEEWEI